jgi:hypothetical protein
MKNIRLYVLTLIATAALLASSYLAAPVAVAAIVQGMTHFTGLDITPGATNTNSLVVRNSSGTAKITTTAAGATTFAGAVTTSSAFTAPGGATVTCTGCITQTNLADTARTVSTPLYAWRTSAGAAPLAIVAGTTPNTATEGNFETFEWATGEQASKIETTIMVPDDYVSGMKLVIWHAHDAAAANNAETFSCSWYTAANGGADNPAAADEGAIAITEAETVTKTDIDLDAAATIAAGQPLRVLFGFTAIDQKVHVFGLGFTYLGK